MAGFTFTQRLSGTAPTHAPITAKNTATYTAGDMLNLESGEVDLGAAGDSNFVGVCLHTIAATDSVTQIMCVWDADAVYSVTDANARLKGDTLDIAGATGAQGVAASSGKEFVVHATCTASEPTLVRFNVGKHHNNKAQ